MQFNTLTIILIVLGERSLEFKVQKKMTESTESKSIH